jgi:hypothetical protein
LRRGNSKLPWKCKKFWEESKVNFLTLAHDDDNEGSSLILNGFQIWALSSINQGPVILKCIKVLWLVQIAQLEY